MIFAALYKAFRCNVGAKLTCLWLFFLLEAFFSDVEARLLTPAKLAEMR